MKTLKFKQLPLRVIIAVATGCMMSSAFALTTYYVSPDGSGDAFTYDNPGVLQDALDAVTANYASFAKDKVPTSYEAGYEVILKKGTYDFSASEGVTPGFGSGKACAAVSAHWVVIRAEDGAKPSEVTLLGGGEETDMRGFSLRGRIRVVGLCITNCVTSGYGGAVYCNNSAPGQVTYVYMPSFSNCEFRCCSATQGGAVYWGNTAMNEDTVGCVFENNSATDFGAAIRIDTAKDALRIRRCAFVGNQGGRGIVWAGSDASANGGGFAEDCGFTNNVCTLAVLGNGGQATTATRCNFVGNQAGTCLSWGGVARDCQFIRNSGSNTGGACLSGGSAYDCGFLCNTNAMPSGTYDAYGLVIQDAKVVSNCWFTGNCATGGRYKKGGAAGGAGMLAVDCAFTNNVADGGGGVLCSNAGGKPFTALRCSFVGNSGGIASSGGSLVNCVCISNTAWENVCGGYSVATNCLFFGNRCSGPSATAATWTRFINCTIAKNYPGRGFLGAHALAINTFFYQNSNGDMGDGTGAAGASAWVSNCVFTSGYYTGAINNRSMNGPAAIAETLAFLKENCGCVTSLDGLKFNDLTNPDIGFRPLKGSSTQDAGQDVGFGEKSRDLAGAKRVCGEAVDIGCYEYNPTFGFMLILK